MKIALISDIHGNMQALEAVLNDIEKEKCDKIYCLGDLAMAGPEPVKTIEVIKKLYDAGKLDLIQGNTDLMIANYSQWGDTVKEKFPIMGNALEDDVKQISNDIKIFLKNLPEQKELTIEGENVLLVHGSPRKNDENIMPDLLIKDVEEIISGTKASVIFCGHTHIPCGYQTETNQTVVNVGSVGRPFTKNPQSCYVIADFRPKNVEIKHKFIDYNNEKASEILSDRKFKGAFELSKMLVNPELRYM